MTEDELIETMARAMVRVGSPWVTPEKDPGEWRDWVDEARAAFSAMRAAGYVLVPVEATEEMINVGRDTSRTENVRDHSLEGRIRRIYRDMLAASPIAKEVQSALSGETP